MFTPSDATNNELDELHVDPNAELVNYTRKNAICEILTYTARRKMLLALSPTAVIAVMARRTK